jgi:transposase
VEVVYQRVAAIDVNKKQITVAVRTPGERAGQRRQQVRKYATFYSALREMTGWLLAEQVTHVAMEATGVYWRPVFHALAQPDALEILLCNAYHVKNVPGRKTDACDAVWLAQLREVGLLRGSFLPPADIAAVRELVRYRKKLISDRGRETQRLHKVLGDGGIKLDSVASDAIGVSGRALMEALIAGGKKAAVATAHTLLVIIWHLLAHGTTYTDLGTDYYTPRDDPEIRKQRLLRQLPDLGYDAELTPVAA